MPLRSSGDRMGQNTLQQAIFRWLIIACVVLALLTSVLLALGYMLKENERKTRALIEASQHDQQSTRPRAQQVVTAQPHAESITPLIELTNEVSPTTELLPLSEQSQLTLATQGGEESAESEVEAKVKAQLLKDLARLRQLEQAKQTILNNLVCQDVSQCRFVDTSSIELGCVVAVNTIGKSMLSKAQFVQTFSQNDSECEERISELSLTCHHNMCSIE
ncbi:hypothetical protein [Thalassotalea euphylliae]|uniref:Uncharacterized protein n=1 Tax=Thalassotalea euphylliae TaxID=1655234 RepID=A0A3E0U498_9GAMM|nr:hypothetical protein [Thalassotalea euphylliae]REL30802.1 hypothetical protein DXX94_08765 [Thalassotalea euphylliae]